MTEEYTFGGGYCWYVVETGDKVGKYPMLDAHLRKTKFN